jgi:hypothetical protein
MVHPPSLPPRKFIPYFNDTRLEAETCQMRKHAKGAWLLGFVRLDRAGGLDMRFLGRKWQKKKQIPWVDY